jgi:hypothetical protein
MAIGNGNGNAIGNKKTDANDKTIKQVGEGKWVGIYGLGVYWFSVSKYCQLCYFNTATTPRF